MAILNFISSNLFLIILTFILILIIVYNFAIRTNKVSGSLIFLDGATIIAEFGLYGGTNLRIIGSRELRSYPQLMLKRLKITNQEAKTRAASDTFYANDNRGVKVSAVASDGRKFTIELWPNIPITYSDLTFAQMMYEPVK